MGKRAAMMVARVFRFGEDRGMEEEMDGEATGGRRGRLEAHAT
jgi:hypothetical protein